MKAIVQDKYGSADVLRLADIDVPEIGDADVLVRVRAAGVDPSVWHLMTGQPYLVRVMGLRGPKNPVRGWDAAGHVEAVGKAVTAFRPGDEVCGACDGSFAEYARARQDRLVPKPATLSFEQAAAIPVSAQTALQALRDKGEVKPGQQALIIGAGGGVGTFAVQIAKALGAEVTGVCSTTKTELVRSIGADHIVDYLREDFTDGRRRYDVILDAAGNRPLLRLRRALVSGGTLVLVGGEGGGRWLGGVDRLLRALVLSPFVGRRLRPFLASGRKADLEFLMTLVETGRLRPVIDRTYTLREVPDAIRYLERGHARGKVVITV